MITLSVMEHENVYKVKQSQSVCVCVCARARVRMCMYSFNPDLAPYTFSWKSAHVSM